MSFKKVNRSYHSTPDGWRLAKFEEAKNGVEEIKKHKILGEFDRARLLDGWISGPGYNYEMGNDFRGCMGYMLLIQTQAPKNPETGTAYASVTLNDSQKQVALFLCVDDLNYEVAYWVLNMDLQDVTQGRIPFRNPAKFKEMNFAMCFLARMLGDKGPIIEKPGETKFSSRDSVRDILSEMMDIVKDYPAEVMEIVKDYPAEVMEIVKRYPDGIVKDYPGEVMEIVKRYPDEVMEVAKVMEIVKRYPDDDAYTIYDCIGACSSRVPELAWLENVSSQGGEPWKNIAEAFWNFLSESVAGLMVQIRSASILKEICQVNGEWKLGTLTSREENFMVASLILLYLSSSRIHFIHAPLEHECQLFCALKICYGASENVPPDFNQRLQSNAMWRCYDQNYDLLNKLLIFAPTGPEYSQTRVENYTSILVIKRLLECGAQVKAAAYVHNKKMTALESTIQIKDEDHKIEVVHLLLEKCELNVKKQLVNTTYDNGRTYLHYAAMKGEVKMCKKLLDSGAKLDIDGKTALHVAVENEQDAVVDVFMKHPKITQQITKLVDSEDSPLDEAIANRPIEFVVKLLPKSRKPEAHFKKVNADKQEQLLRHFLVEGYVDIVANIQKGTKLPTHCNAQKQTVLHLAAMCKDETRAKKMVEIIQEKEKLVAEKDIRGRTALYEAALNGHKDLCSDLLNIDQEIIYLTDRDGLTPLHVAASIGDKELVDKLISCRGSLKSDFVSSGDLLGQTALHKAAQRADRAIVEYLLEKGAHPLERDCDGRTALHYLVQAESGEKKKVAELLLKKCKSNEEKLLLLWASAAGIGTAECKLSDKDELHDFLVKEKGNGIEKCNLLQAAALTGNIEMSKELITRGYSEEDLHDPAWRNSLQRSDLDNVKTVSGQLEKIADQGNDQPTLSDNLGRTDYARGLAALLLNPYIKPPIAVGISGSWGMGKSSLMIKTESILLQTAAQAALLPLSQLSSSASELPGIKTFNYSTIGKKKYEEIRRHVDYEQRDNRNLFSTLIHKIKSWRKTSNTQGSQAEVNSSNSKIKTINTEESPKKNEDDEQNALRTFLLKNYEAKLPKIFRTLAAMDSSDMFERKESTDQKSKTKWDMMKSMVKFTKKESKDSKDQKSNTSKSDSSQERRVPAVLTIQYNAWKYMNGTEALAGMAVEITKELEGMMTLAQWLNTCWRSAWKKKKYNILIEIIFPSLLTIFLVSVFSLIVWIILDRLNLKNWAKAKYASLPLAVFITGWTLTRSVMANITPVSTQLMSYVSVPDHSDKLGYQERVISDITFLKHEIGEKPNMLFTAIAALWFLITEWWLTLLFFHPKFLRNIPRLAPALGNDLRIIVFIDDLDRCQESAILQVLSAINLVLAVCEINVVLGIDKGLVERAIIKSYGEMETNKSFELADKYLQKIIQLPLDLPDPDEEQSKKFLEVQLGGFEGADSKSKVDAPMIQSVGRRTSMPVTDATTSREEMLHDDAEKEVQYYAINVHDATETGISEATMNNAAVSLSGQTGISEASTSNAAASLSGQTVISEATTSNAVASPSGQTGAGAPPRSDLAQNRKDYTGNRNSWTPIPIRELLFVRYSKREKEVFDYFRQWATGSRKLPREWKRLLTYHRLVWNMLYITKKANESVGWQVALITWIFICWEWKETMNFVIQNWNNIGVLKTSEPDGPSLKIIVEHFIKQEKAKKLEESAKDSLVSEDASPQLSKEKIKKNEEVRETSLPENIDDQERSKSSVQEKMDNAVKREPDTLEKTLRKELDELKKEIQDLKSEILKQQSGKNEKKELDELKKEIQYLKCEVQKQHSEKNKEEEEENRRKLENWKRLNKLSLALDKYDVKMPAILAFQRFRFYCMPRHLSWPVPEEEIEEP